MKLLGFIIVIGLFVFIPEYTSAYICSPTIICGNDSACNSVGGFCVNRNCRCGESDPGICSQAERCDDRGLEFSSPPGGGTIHIGDCRGANSGGTGGVISYCFGPACVPNQGSGCQSAPNICGMRNNGTVQCNGSCSASPPPDSLCGALPIGSHDAANCTASFGWAFDSDFAGSTSVHLYEGATLLAAVTANGSRPDVGAVYPGRTNSGWSWPIPSSLKNGASHTITAYAINVNSSGTPQGINPALASSRTILCSEPPVGTFSAATCGTASGNATDPQGSPVQVAIYDGLVGAGGVQIGTGNASPNFSISFAPFTDGLSHTLYAYGRDVPSGVWYQLTGSHAVACPPTVNIRAIPPTVPYGNASRISWSSINATTCTASNGSVGWPGIRAANGNYLTGALTTTTTYTLACTGAGGTVTGNTTVTVNPPPPPSANLTLISQPDYCSAGPALTASWLFTDPSGLTQSQYRFQVARDAAFSDFAHNPGIVLGDATTATTGPGTIAYATPYWARVRVWSSAGVPSAWSNVLSTTTPIGPYPQVSFTITPPLPAANSETTFTDTTDYGSGTVLTREWDFGDGTIVSESPGTGTIIHIYTSPAVGMAATLTTSSTNSTPATCAATLIFGVNKPIPQYREVRPGTQSSPTP